MDTERPLTPELEAMLKEMFKTALRITTMSEKLEDIEIVDYKPTPIVESIAYRS